MSDATNVSSMQPDVTTNPAGPGESDGIAPIGPALQEEFSKLSVARLPLENDREVPLQELLKELGGDLSENLECSLDLLTGAENVAMPVVGVCGMMNTGKSSLVAHLLSPQGQSRVLIGIRSEDGTHRFVFWVPASWSTDNQKRKALERMLENAFGEPPEELSQDPEKAFAQYNARDNQMRQLGIPLLAFDPALDEHGLVLLDCPDIQRQHGNTPTQKSSSMRKQMLEKAGELCSAFFIVSSNEQLEDSKIREVLACTGGTGSGLPLYFVLTKVNQAGDDKIWREIEKRLDEIQASQRLRAAYVDPYFSVLPADGSGRYRRVFGEPADIRHVCKQLDHEKLRREYLVKARATVKKNLGEACEALANHEKMNRETTMKARATLLNFLDHHFNGKDKGLRPIYDKDLVLAMLESISRTAPWYAWPTIKMARIFSNSIDALRSGGKKIIEMLPWWRARIPKQQAEIERLKQIDEKSLKDVLRDRSWMPPHTTDEQIEKVWSDSFQLMAQGGNVDESALRAELDANMRKVWKSASAWKKMTCAASAPFVLAAGLTAVLLVPIDWGGSTILLAATLPELLSALGLGFLTGSGAGKMLQKVVEKHAARPQLSALFNYLQDHLGLPRAGSEELKRMQENKGLSLATSPKDRQGPIIRVLADPVFELDKAAMAQIESRLV